MSENQDTNAVDQIVADVLAARKYRSVCADTVRRFAMQEWARRGGQSARRAIQEATKATRSRLHQAYGAYESKIDYERAYRDLEAAYTTGRHEEVRSACRRLLALHASTRERLPILDRLYGEVFARTGLPGILLDLACGLNPLSLPWMGLGEGATYHAYDIDGQRTDLMNRYLSLSGLSGGAHFQDILTQPPEEPGDVALLLKSSACLERQRAGATLALLDALRVRHVAVSFPVRSLGGHDKGMPEQYERTFIEMLSGRPWPVTQLRFETELVFLVEKG